MIRPIELAAIDGGVPIHMFVTDALWPDMSVMTRLQELARAPGLDHYMAVLPDVHHKRRNLSPTGMVVVSAKALLPHAVDAGINCGIGMLRTDIDVRDLQVAVLDALFGTLMRRIPVFQHERQVLSNEDIASIFAQGSTWCKAAFDLSDTELQCIEDRGTAYTDTDDTEAILDSMPRKTFVKGRRRFGTLGGGNHFLEMQEITEILDHNTATMLGLHLGKAVFMLHTCGRGVGSKMMHAYRQELERQFFTEHTSGQSTVAWSVPADSDPGIRYTRALAAATNFGFANRIAITEQIRRAVRSVLHDYTLQLPLLYDCSHVSIKPELWDGKRLWVHRHGASRAVPASHFPDHPIFSKTGQPVPIPGSMGDASYIGVAGATTASTFWSVNHGAGRALDKPEAAARFTQQQVERYMLDHRIRLYRYGTDNIAEQAPGSFKDISQVMTAMSALSLAEPVVRLRPIAVLKG